MGSRNYFCIRTRKEDVSVVAGVIISAFPDTTHFYGAGSRKSGLLMSNVTTVLINNRRLPEALRAIKREIIGFNGCFRATGVQLGRNNDAKLTSLAKEQSQRTRNERNKKV